MTFSAIPTPVVVDASVAFEFLNGEPRWVEAFDNWSIDDRLLMAPALFLAEVANGHLRGHGTAADEIARRLNRLVDTGVEITDRGLPGLVEAIGLADQHGLTVYDALYLQLALDVDANLATLDDDLQKAALAEGLEVVR